ncbi:hypothetical protein SAMN05192534_12431 [Alteribacillus persepolensis]|uniref:Uncharacterized protein n=1 Tax=Alteribacillus persepolensis TaxID=568899 RepID=A0A1G8IHT3_9BACI|nr:hypothetical protein [Alteribacillus persepolensis]SDI18569.1 hypothetical protein SAMN05192534_12431 [Alteribacillus persepolensis]
MVKKFDDNTPVIILENGNKGTVINTVNGRVLVESGRKGHMKHYKESELKHDVDTILRQIHARQGKLLGQEKEEQ